MASEGISWNQNQLKILYLLQHGKTVTEISQSEGKGFGYSLCKKVEGMMKAGKIPGEVTDEMIKKAPKSVEFGKYNPSLKNKGTVTPTLIPATPPKASASAKTPALYTTQMELVAQTQAIPMTNDIHISYFLALAGGYDGSLAEWLSMVSSDFWLGRGRNMYAEYGEIMIGKKEEAVAKPS